MAYELHIVRDDRIAIDAWRKVVAETSGVRLTSENIIIINPESRETINLGFIDGDVDVLFSAKDEWYPIFRWHASKGYASFNAEHFRCDPVRTVASSLAHQLGAQIRGDEGESYPFEAPRLDLSEQPSS